MNKQKISSLFRPEHTITLLGGKGSGKTNTACVLMESLIKYGFTIYTNIHFFDLKDVGLAIAKHKLLKNIDYQEKHQNIHIVSSLSGMMHGLVFEGKKVVILDEAGIHASSSQPMSKTTVAIKQLTYIIRHFNACIVFIAQTKGSLPPDLREKLVDYEINVYRQSRSMTLGKRSIAYDDYNVEYIDFPIVDEWAKIPHSTFPYDSNFPTGFEMDIDLKQTLGELSKLKSSMAVEGEEGRKVVEDIIGKTKKKKK